jgi:hypothetical protein
VSLRWEQRSSGRWLGFDGDGRQVGFVAETVTAGGDRRYWLAWRSDGTPDGVTVGEFTTAEAAMAAVS